MKQPMTYLMKKSQSCIFLVVAVALAAHSAAAQPVIAANGIRNGGSYALPGLSNAGIAQGSIFVVFGQGLGPAKIVQVSSFPLPTSQGLAGTSIKITVGGTTVDAIMLYTLASQVAAVLPSSTPTGAGTLTVTYSGQTSAPAPITVVQGSFGIFAVNQAGSGPGVLQNVNSATDRPLNTATQAASPGQVIILWGTGLGPVAGNEAGGALPGDMPNLNLHVFVGGKEAAVQYRGRSGCCTGVDQIVFTVPAGVEGCNVGVFVQIDNVVSNFVSMSIASSGSVCNDPNGLSPNLLKTAMQNGGLRGGVLDVERFYSETPKLKYRNDNLGATFVKTSLDALGHSIAPSLGSCSVNQFPGYVPPGANVGLDAGKVSAATPIGSYNLLAIPGYKGAYGLSFSPSTQGSIPGIINDGNLLKPGAFTFTAGGGADVGPVTASINFPLSFAWTNDASVTSINRYQPLTITWSGGTPGATVLIEVQSSASQGIGAVLLCYVDATLGTFIVPAAVLSALPPSFTSSGAPQGSFAVEEFFYGDGFTAQGIDYGQTMFADGVNKGPMAIQ